MKVLESTDNPKNINKEDIKFDRDQPACQDTVTDELKKLSDKSPKLHKKLTHRAWVMGFQGRLPLWWYPYPKYKVKKLLKMLKSSKTKEDIKQKGVIHTVIQFKCEQAKNSSTKNGIRKKRKINKVITKNAAKRSQLVNKQGAGQEHNQQLFSIDADTGTKLNIKHAHNDFIYLPDNKSAYAVDLTNIGKNHKSIYDLDSVLSRPSLVTENETKKKLRENARNIKMYPVGEPIAELEQNLDSHTLIREAAAMLSGFTALVAPYEDRIDYLTAYQFNCMLMPIHDKLVCALKLMEQAERTNQLSDEGNDLLDDKYSKH